MRSQSGSGDSVVCRGGVSLFSMLALLWLAAGGFRLKADESPAQAVISTPEVDVADIKLSDGTWKDVEAILKDNVGRIVIVDIWSTSCLPCMTEFPHLVELQKTHGERVLCVSYNLDYVGIKTKPHSFYRAKVEKFLQEKKAGIVNLLSTVEADKVFEQLDLTSIPAVYVYGADGKLARRFDDSLLEDGEEEAFTYEKDINPFVEELLKSSPESK
jgi:thiol-disulfide isomerase/thioredoxin